MDNGITDIIKIEVISDKAFAEHGDFVEYIKRVYRDWDDKIKIETTEYHKEIFIIGGRRYQLFIEDKSGADIIRTMLEESRKLGIEQGRAQEKIFANYKRFTENMTPLTPLLTSNSGDNGITGWIEEDS